MIPNILSIAGSDPSGGAGIQADLKTFAALDCYGMAAVTALTAQNTQGVSAIHVPPAEFVAEQIRMVFSDIEVAAVKVGMLGSADVVEAVAQALSPYAHVPIVVDPVLVATSGAPLGDEAVVSALWTCLFPLARLVTPNLPEAARLACAEGPASREDIEDLARQLAARTSCAWLLKGGHAQGETADDLLVEAGEPRWFSSPRIDTTSTHGTGCTLSSAIAVHLARKQSLADAVRAAKTYLQNALAGADRLAVGHGAGPLDHLAPRR